jgi:monovalent cation:H+ antiporter-2, CPA2 family
MPHEVTLITTIAAGFGLALVFGYLAARLKMPPLVGYLFAGILIGPATPGFVADIGLASQLAEIGVMLLMFGVGLHFSVQDLLSVRKLAIPGALLQIFAATAMGALAAHFWNWSLGGSIVFGLCLSVASTVVLLRALEAKDALDSTNGKIAIGWLVVEDLVMVLALVLLPALDGVGEGAATQTSGSGLDLLFSAGSTIAKVLVFIALMMLLGKKLLPKLLWLVSKTGSRELFTLAVIAVAIGVAFGSAKIFSVSFALGAFFAGMVMRESEFSHRAADESLPFRDAFAVLFFVSVGMMFEPKILLEAPERVLLVLLIILVGKSIAAVTLVLAMRYPLGSALTIAASLAQIGEFSFILGSLGMSLGLMPPEGMSLILAGAILSIALNPLVFASIEPIQKWLHHHSGYARELEKRVDPLAQLPSSVDSGSIDQQVVVIGYGEVGKAVCDRLAEQGVKYIVLDQRRELIEALRARGISAVCGDASTPGALIQAHVARASAMVVTVEDMFLLGIATDISRQLNASLRIVTCFENADDLNVARNSELDIAVIANHEFAKSIALAATGKIRD